MKQLWSLAIVGLLSQVHCFGQEEPKKQNQSRQNFVSDLSRSPVAHPENHDQNFMTIALKQARAEFERENLMKSLQQNQEPKENMQGN